MMRYFWAGARTAAGLLTLSLAVLLLLLTPAAALGHISLYVATQGSDVTGDGSPATPVKTIARAIEIIVKSGEDHPEIHIAKGTYTENVVLLPDMNVFGGYAYPGWTRDVAANPTIIKSASADPGSVTLLADTNNTLDGLIIEGGYFGVRVPGAILTARQCTFKLNTIAGISALNAAQVTIENCLFDRPGNGINAASGTTLTVADSQFIKCSQYGLFADTAQLTVERTRFDTCSQDGLYLRNAGITLRRVISAHNLRHGLRLQSCTGLIENSIFGDNDTGITMQTSAGITVQNSTLAGNRISAFVCDASTPDLRNNIFSGSRDYGLEERIGTIGPARLSTNCFHGNLKADYLDGGTTPTLGAAAINSTLRNGAGLVQGNIDGDPKVLYPLEDAFYLAIGSSCLDAAEPIAGLDTDFYGLPRPFDFPATDNNGADSDTDIGAIEFRGIPHFDFSRGGTKWALTTLPFFFNPPEGRALPERLLIKSNNVLTFGFWTSPFNVLPALPGKTYMIEWTISTDVADRGIVPTFRTRALNESGKVSNTFGVNSSGPGDSSPVAGAPQIYRMYFSPLQGGLAQDAFSQIILGFDILQFDVNDQIVASFFIEDVKITELDKAAFLGQFSDISFTDFTTGQNGWQTLPPLSPPVTMPAAAATTRGLELKAQDNLFCFGSWFGPPVNSVGMKTVYMRGVFGSDATSQATAPTFRMRINSLNNQTFCDMAVNSVAQGEASPAQGGTFAYEVFFEAPAVSMDSMLLPVYDLMNFDPNDDPTPTVWLQSLEIKGLAVP